MSLNHTLDLISTAQERLFTEMMDALTENLDAAADPETAPGYNALLLPIQMIATSLARIADALEQMNTVQQALVTNGDGPRASVRVTVDGTVFTDGGS